MVQIRTRLIGFDNIFRQRKIGVGISNIVRKKNRKPLWGCRKVMISHFFSMALPVTHTDAKNQISD